MHMFEKGHPDLRFGAEFPVVVGSGVYFGDTKCPVPEFKGASFICTGFTIDGSDIKIHATDDMGRTARIF